jgi:type VI secretion system protein ImpG
MDPRLLSYYERELQHLREMGGEFAREFPRIAGRLGLETLECADPYVERLLEGFAFLTARVQLKIDAEFPRFTQHLLELVYPHYLAPIPSMAVVEMKPRAGEGALVSGVKIPAGSVMRSLLGKGEQTTCDYRTSHEVTLWPIELTEVKYTEHLGDLGGIKLPTRKTARAALRLTLRTAPGVRFEQLPLEHLPLFLRGGDELAMRVYEQLIGNVMAAALRKPGLHVEPAYAVIGAPATRAIGFEDSEALLPYGPRSFQGYRLLQEYFACASRFLFVDLVGLGPGVRKCKGDELEIVLFLEKQESGLEGAISASHISLHCTPAVNLFPRRADRIHLNEGSNEYHVVPDRTRPMDFEVYAISEVSGYGDTSDATQEFRPLYAVGDLTPADAARAYYTVHRQPRKLSGRQQAEGPRSSYVGSEVFLALVDGTQGPFRSALKQLGVTCLCSNRDLPLHMPVGQGRTDFTLESGAPVESIRCVAGPTRPRASYAHGDVSWRLISHLALNYLSLTDSDGHGAGALRQMLSLYADTGELAVRKQIEGVRSVSAAPIVRRMGGAGPMTFGRGVEVTLICDEAAFKGTGVFLLGSVLARFFSKHVTLNSFTETVLKSGERGEIMRWPAETGRRAVL